MGYDVGFDGASLQYQEAHGAHYGAKKLRKALDLYKKVISAHPDSPEAGYSRSQIHNIVKAVVPMEKLVEAEKALALAHLESR